MGNTGSKENIKEALKELSDRGKIKTMEDEFWTTYWQTNIMSLKELLGLVSLDEIRQIKLQNRSNFITFCLHCMNQIFKLCKSSAWSDTDGIVINNSIKWLVRLFPAIMEDRDLIGYFWDSKNDACLQPYASSLMQNICELLFRQGYCAPICGEYSPPDPLNTSSIWKPGLVVKVVPSSTDFIDENRKNCLSLLMLILSQEFYYTRDDSIIFPDKWSIWFKSKNNKFSILLLTSLINYICFEAKEIENSWTYFGKTQNFDLLYKCIHTLMICLCSSIENQESTDEITKRHKNIFVDLVESFHKKDDIDLIISSLNSLIKFSLRKSFRLNRNSFCEFHQECLVLLWRFCIFNQKFMSFLLISPFMTSIIFSFLLYLHDVKADNSEIGFVHTCLSLLLFLSSERQFAIIMNSIYEGKSYFDLPKNCSYNDYLIYCLAKVVSQGSESTLCLHETIASIIYNVSPYITLTSMVASFTMICMLETCVSNMTMENAPQSVYKVISLLLDSFNNIICHGFNNNPYIIFCTVLSSKVFYKLDSLSSYSPTSNGHLDDDNASLYELDKDALAQFSTKNIVRLLDILVPQVEKLCNEIVDFNEEYVAKFLKRSTIVGLINKPTQILTRRFEVLDSVANWIHMYTWTVIYLRNTDIPVYAESKINLFIRNKTES